MPSSPGSKGPRRAWCAALILATKAAQTKNATDRRGYGTPHRAPCSRGCLRTPHGAGSHGAGVLRPAISCTYEPLGSHGRFAMLGPRFKPERRLAGFGHHNPKAKIVKSSGEV